VSGRSPVRRPYTADAVGPDQQTKTRHRLRRLGAVLGAVVLGALVFAPAASAGWFLPESNGSPNAEAIRTLYILIAIIGLVIFIGVEGLLIYSMFKFRAKRGRVAAQIHGNTQLEIGWTVGAAAILIFLTVFTFVLLDDVKNPAASEVDAEGNPITAANTAYAATDQPAPPGDGAKLNIRVVGEQYAWSFFYPEVEGQERVYAYNDMYVPAGVTVTLDIQSKDVAHSWWIPELGGKADALPGYTNKTWFRVPLEAVEGQDRVVYEGQCAELCGRNHADMLARVIALPFDEWQEWREQKAQELAEAQDAAAQEREQETATEGEGG
jgi:cytochrome c oxidase subunit II